jgi:hypothetical protein
MGDRFNYAMDTFVMSYLKKKCVWRTCEAKVGNKEMQSELVKWNGLECKVYVLCTHEGHKAATWVMGNGILTM